MNYEYIEYLENRCLKTLESIKNQSHNIIKLNELVIQSLKNKGKVIFCGNGGSFSQALHLSAELTGRFKLTRKPLPSLCLGSNAAALTCIANDFSFGEVFSRELECLGSKNDILICLTTSGKSKNVINAAKVADSIGMKTILLVGPENSECQKYAFLTISLGQLSTAQIQEGHLLIGHEICKNIDENLIEGNL